VVVVMLMKHVVDFWDYYQSFGVTHCCLLRAKVVWNLSGFN